VITRRLRQGGIVALGDNPNYFKAHEDAITQYKEINGDVDVSGAKFNKLCFI